MRKALQDACEDVRNTAAKGMPTEAAERLLVGLAKEQNVPADAIQYLNRLSDALFVWSRWVNHVLGASETLWEPNAAASGRQNQ